MPRVECRVDVEPLKARSGCVVEASRLRKQVHHRFAARLANAVRESRQFPLFEQMQAHERIIDLPPCAVQLNFVAPAAYSQQLTRTQNVSVEQRRVWPLRRVKRADAKFDKLALQWIDFYLQRAALAR